MLPNEITKEQYELWVDEYKRFWNAFHTMRPLDREASMMYLMERMLLRVRLHLGYGDPGSTLPPPVEPTPDAHDNPEGFREED